MFASVDFSFGDVNNQNLDIHDMRWKESSQDIRTAFKHARGWARSSWFVSTVLRLQASFFRHGFKLVSGEVAKKTAKSGSAQTKLDEWLAINRRGAFANRFCLNSIDEWLLQDNVISFWRDNPDERRRIPLILRPELCRYSDRFGIEKLFWAPGYNSQLKADATGLDQTEGLRSSEVQRYSKNEIALGQGDEQFQVLTRQLRGDGLGWPQLFAVFRTLAQCESMEVGEAQYAMLGRRPIEQHAIGFEVKNSGLAQSQASFLFKKKRAAEIEAFMKGAMGLTRIISQFDHVIKYIWTDPKNFGGEKWGTIVQRLLWWAGPVGQMLLSKSVSPYLMPLLHTSMEESRNLYLIPYLEEVLAQSMLGVAGAPKMKVKFSSRIFKDPRLAWTMTKDLLTTGPLSGTTALHEGGFDPEQEKEQKGMERENPEDYLPTYDPNHGSKPGDNKLKEKGARPIGSKDGDVVK